MKVPLVFAIVLVLLSADVSSDRTGTNKINEPLVAITTQLTKLFEEIQNVTTPQEVPDICAKCELIVSYVITFRKSGANSASMNEYLSRLCTLLYGYLPSVCDVFSEIETDVIIHIIDNKDIKPVEVCGTYFQHLGCINPYAKNWTIDIPTKANSISEEIDKISQTPLKIVQITDVHYDPLYKVNSNAKCEEPLCCEGSNGSPTDPKNAAGLFGDYRVCDMPKNSIVSLLTEIRKSQKNIDYVYFTGDIIAHMNWKTSRDSNLATIKEFYELLFHYLGNVTVYPILGNHEAHPCNLYAPMNIPVAIGTQWLFEAVADYWSRWLPQSALETIKIGGYYTILVRPGFRIVALNSNVCFTENLWLVYADEDPYRQLKWLAQVLLAAEKNNEKVHILSHVPPGEANCHRRWQYNFNRIIQRFARIVSAQFNGHTHMDEFRIFKNETNRNQVVNVAYNGGSFTTFIGLNPDYRVYDVNDRNFMVVDYHQYTFNMSLANSPRSPGPEWYKLYSFRSAYGLKNMNYDSLLDLSKRFRSDAKLAEQYIQYYVRQSEFAFENGCNETCVQSQICHISAVDADESIGCGSYTIFN